VSRSHGNYAYSALLGFQITREPPRRGTVRNGPATSPESDGHVNVTSQGAERKDVPGAAPESAHVECAVPLGQTAALDRHARRGGAKKSAGLRAV
jgi:hypothetical protein